MTGTVIVLFTFAPAEVNNFQFVDSVTWDRQIYSINSTDEGRSWSAPRNLSSLHDEQHRRWCDSSSDSRCNSRGIWCQTSAAGGSGIQTSSGRLVIPAYHYDCPHVVEASNTWISDDHGLSWKSSDEFGFKTCEGAVTQLFHPPAGVAPADYLRVSLRTDKTFHPWGICMNCSAACEAHQGDPAFCPVCHCRRTALSTDGGATWGNFTDQGAVPDPKSRGGLTRWPERKALVLANCAN